jgi:hypothetical protein
LLLGEEGRNASMIDSHQQLERRDANRFSLRLACLLQERHHRDNVLKLYTRDISSYGAFFYLGHRLPMDAPVEMNLLLPLRDSNQSLLSTQGKVIRSDRKGIAVRFDSEIKIPQPR